MLAGLVVGALNSLQARMNGELSSALGEPVYAALWPFGTGWLILTGLLLAQAPMRAGVARVREQVRAGRLARWHTVGGVVGGLFVLTQAYAVPPAGVALFTVAFVCGQLTGGLLVDRWGLGPAGRSAVTARRIGAAALALSGVAVAVFGRAGGPAAAPLLPVLLSVLVGAAVAAQQATNGRVNAVSGLPLATSWLNFCWGCATLLVAGAIGVLQGRGLHPSWPSVPWWAWFGGLIGILFIATGAVIVRRIGVLATMLVLVVGQLAGAVVLDLLHPAARHTVTWVVLLGVALTAAGGALAATRRAPRHGGPPPTRVGG